jgi:N4-gp56 family major capsid protein
MANTNVTTTTQIDAGVDVYYDRLFLERALPVLPHMRWGQKRPIKAGSGDTIKLRRYASLSVATTPLDEVVDPNPEQLGKTDITAQTSLYGKVVKVSSQVDLTVPDNVGAEATELLSENYAETLDELTRDVIAATASTTTCSNGSPTATLLNKTDIDAVVQTLLGNRARFTAGMIKAGTGQGTSPLRNAFMAIADTDLLDDLEAVTGFKSTSTYPTQTPVQEGEWGVTGNVRWVLTDKGYVSGSNYTCPIIGKNAYGLVDITGGGSKLIHHPPKIAGSDLELYGTYGWKENYVARILNDNFLHGLICTNG